MAKSNGKFVQLGSMMVKKELGRDGKKAYYIKIPKDTVITVNGKQITGEFINVERPADKFKRMLDKGSITQEEYEAKVARFAQDGDLSFIQFELSAIAE